VKELSLLFAFLVLLSGCSEKVETKTIPVVSDPTIYMYATDWCGYCAKARAYFDERGIEYIEYDIDKDADAKQRHTNLGKIATGKQERVGVPLFVIDTEILLGFEPSKLGRVIDELNKNVSLIHQEYLRMMVHHE